MPAQESSGLNGARGEQSSGADYQDRNHHTIKDTGCTGPCHTVQSTRRPLTDGPRRSVSQDWPIINEMPPSNGGH